MSSAAASELSATHSRARRLVLELRGGLERLEAGRGGAAADKDKLRDALRELHDAVERMRRGWRALGARDATLWKRRVEQIAADFDDLSTALDRHAVRERQRAMEEAERKELLRRTRGGGDAVREMSDFDLESGTNESAKRSEKAVEDMMGMGEAVLGAYASQRERLKGAERKVLTVLNELGLSDSMLRAVEKRHVVDKVILASGMLLTLLLVWGLFSWVRR